MRAGNVRDSRQITCNFPRRNGAPERALRPRSKRSGLDYPSSRGSDQATAGGPRGRRVGTSVPRGMILSGGKTMRAMGTGDEIVSSGAWPAAIAQLAAANGHSSMP